VVFAPKKDFIRPVNKVTALFALKFCSHFLFETLRGRDKPYGKSNEDRELERD
jgi:hypothetical protein